MKLAKVAGIVIVALVLLIGGFLWKTYRDAGEFKSIKAHGPEGCRTVSGVDSSEDITIDARSAMAFISSDDRRPWFHGKKGKQGAIYGYNLRANRPRLINLTRNFEKEFHPHGIGLYAAPSGTTYVFVVNHVGGKQYIEIFELAGDRLHHKETVSGPLMSSPNDVLPVGPRKFYVTNDHGSASMLGRKLEDYLQLARSYVLYFDGEQFKKVAEGLKYANGINISPDGKTIYVASTTGKAVYLYHRNKADGTLRFVRKISVGTGVDNIEIDTQGRLWLGCHPKLLTFVKYANDPKKRSPSQVLMIKVIKEGKDEIKEVYLNNGNPISGSSVAAYFHGKLLIGSVFDPKFTICQLDGY